ncbi:MAG: LON peptidase substrate-binding domain-containing protein [Burkholderiaceae bacterium]
MDILPMDTPELPLFPLRTVLFPDGVLPLKVFEARYLDMIAGCLRERSRFGVVSLLRGGELHRADQAVDFAPIGVEAELIDVDSAQAGILLVRCRGGRRFEVGATRQQADGLWLATTTSLPADPVTAPGPESEPSVRTLEQAIQSIEAQDAAAFLPPYRYDDAGWVANRWCEILPLPVAVKHRLMALDDPLQRLHLIDEIVRDQAGVS